MRQLSEGLPIIRASRERLTEIVLGFARAIDRRLRNA